MATDALSKFNDVYQRSMLTGVPTTEYNAALAAAGFKPDEVYEATKALEAAGYSTGRPSDENILKYGPTIASQGYGNMSFAPNATVNDAALAEAGYDNYYNQAAKKPSTSYLQKQIAALQTSYNNLVAQQNRSTGGTSGTTGATGGGTTSGGTTVSDAGVSNVVPAATTGTVYGPDGTMYSSAAAAIAAGVTNYTSTRPSGAIAGANTLSNQFVSASKANTGNVNPGGLIGNAQQQLFKNPVSVQKPAVSINPFATTPS